MAKRPKNPNPYADAPYAVGKGKPPQHTRFEKGRSGNPRGAPKKPSLHDEVQKGMRLLLEETVTIRMADGESYQVPAIVALFLKARNSVIETGSPKHLRDFLSTAREFGVLTPEKVQRVGVLVVPPRSESNEAWERDYGIPLMEAHKRAEAETAALLAKALPSLDSQSTSVVEPAKEEAVREERLDLGVPKLPDVPMELVTAFKAEKPQNVSESKKQLAEIREFLEKKRKQGQ